MAIDKTKETFLQLMEGYLEVKRKSKDYGYNDDAFSFKDFTQFHIDLNTNRPKK